MKRRPLLRFCLRRRLVRYLTEHPDEALLDGALEAIERVCGDDVAADAVLEQLDGQREAGTLLEFLEQVVWVRLIEIILEVILRLAPLFLGDKE